MTGPPTGTFAGEPCAGESPAGELPARFSATMVNRVVRELSDTSEKRTKNRWLRAVAARVTAARPDLAEALLEVLGVDPAEDDPLRGLSIGEVGVCYEALLARIDRESRKASGQYFTPDDAARFMAEAARDFPSGVWMDPCTGVGNLAWHLAAVQDDPAGFVRERLILVDRDPDALRSAVALIAADFLAEGDADGVRRLREQAVRRDALTGKLPEHDFVIVNPPYARDQLRRGFQTAAAQESFAYFTERIAKTSRGFVAVTPASYLAAPKFQILRDVIDSQMTGGDVYVFDNVPDTLFRGYKYGSANTSKTNFVRAAITVCRSDVERWRITPIIRWRTASRARMFAGCRELLAPRRIGPAGEWVKLLPGLGEVWDGLLAAPQRLSDLLVREPTDYSLTVALTPRYFISAAYRPLQRGSKEVLYFATAQDRDRAAIVLNSSIPYLWWRALDGGVTLPRRVLRSVPIPALPPPDPRLIARLRGTEEASLVIKLNAGMVNENIKRPRELVDELDALVLAPRRPDLTALYSEDMFPVERDG